MSPPSAKLSLPIVGSSVVSVSASGIAGGGTEDSGREAEPPASARAPPSDLICGSPSCGERTAGSTAGRAERDLRGSSTAGGRAACVDSPAPESTCPLSGAEEEAGGCGTGRVGRSGKTAGRCPPRGRILMGGIGTRIGAGVASDDASAGVGSGFGWGAASSMSVRSGSGAGIGAGSGVGADIASRAGPGTAVASGAAGASGTAMGACSSEGAGTLVGAGTGGGTSVGRAGADSGTGAGIASRAGPGNAVAAGGVGGSGIGTGVTPRRGAGTGGGTSLGVLGAGGAGGLGIGTGVVSRAGSGTTVGASGSSCAGQGSAADAAGGSCAGSGSAVGAGSRTGWREGGVGCG